jgi:hypothetical protein
MASLPPREFVSADRIEPEHAEFRQAFALASGALR